MSRDELLKLLDAGDLHGAMLAVVRAWLEKYHPGTGYAVVLAELGAGLPAVRVPVIPASCSSAATGG